MNAKQGRPDVIVKRKNLLENEGEGSTSGARDYDKAAEDYAKTHDSEAVAEEAARELDEEDAKETQVARTDEKVQDSGCCSGSSSSSDKKKPKKAK